MEEVLTIRLPKGTRRRLERRAKAQKLSVSQLVRRALEQDELLTNLASARAELLPQARAQGIYDVVRTSLLQRSGLRALGSRCRIAAVPCFVAIP